MDKIKVIVKIFILIIIIWKDSIKVFVKNEKGTFRRVLNKMNIPIMKVDR